MGSLRLRAGSIAVPSLYLGLWRALIAVLAILVIAAGVARVWVVLPFFAFALYLMSPHAARLKSRIGNVSLLLLPLVGAVVVSRIVGFQSVDDLPAAMIELVAGFLPLSLASHEKSRSFWLAVLNTAVIAVGCVTFTASIFVYVAFMGFIVLLLLTLNVGNLHLQSDLGDRACVTVPAQYFRQFVHVLPAGIFGAGMIFLSFPRVQSLTMSMDLGARSQTGYSGMISLADGGEIEESQALAFMVTSPDRSWLSVNGPRLLFRGDSLDTFDGSTWKSTVFNYKPREQAPDMRVAARHSQGLQSLMIHREPTSSSAIFYPGVLIDATPQTPGGGDFLYNANGSVIRDVFTLNRYSYIVRVAPPLAEAMLPRESLAQLRERLAGSFTPRSSPYQLSERDAKLYLTVPEGIRTADWFIAWVAGVDVDPTRDNVITASGKLAHHFQSSFATSLKGRLAGDDSLQRFLASEREGHCEYFATAAALLWRTLGLPARVVVGYRGGGFNHLIDALEVREENAHAWIEVFLPDVGWYQFDPTPGGPPAFSESFASMLRMYANAASFFFREYVIDYDYRTQRDLLRSLRDATKRNQGDTFSLKSVGDLGKAQLLIALAVIGVAFLVIRRRVDARDARDLPRFYRDFERKMRRRGLARAPGETFTAFHRRCLEEGVDAELVRRIGGSLEAELYAGTELSSKEHTLLQKAVGRL